MHQIIPILYLATASFTTAFLPFPLGERSIGQSCSIDGESGTCQDTSDCTTQGYNEAGYCPGPSNIQCCVKKTCSTGSGSGICMNTGDTCSGSFVAGACPGDSTVQVSPSRVPFSPLPPKLTDLRLTYHQVLRQRLDSHSPIQRFRPISSRRRRILGPEKHPLRLRRWRLQRPLGQRSPIRQQPRRLRLLRPHAYVPLFPIFFFLDPNSPFPIFKLFFLKKNKNKNKNKAKANS